MTGPTLLLEERSEEHLEHQKDKIQEAPDSQRQSHQQDTPDPENPVFQIVQDLLGSNMTHGNIHGNLQVTARQTTFDRTTHERSLSHIRGDLDLRSHPGQQKTKNPRQCARNQEKNQTLHSNVPPKRNCREPVHQYHPAYLAVKSPQKSENTKKQKTRLAYNSLPKIFQRTSVN